MHGQPGPTPLGQRTVVLDDPLERFPGQVEAVEFGIAMFQRRQDVQRLRIVVKAAIGFQALVQRPLAGMAERRVAEIVRQRQRFRQVLVETEVACQSTGYLRDFQRMGEPCPVVIALVEHEDLGLVLEAPERGRMDHAVAIAPERAAGLARRL